MQITGDLNDEYLTMSMISRHAWKNRLCHQKGDKKPQSYNTLLWLLSFLTLLLSYERLKSYFSTDAHAEN